MEISSEHIHSQTIRARDLKFWEKVHLPPPVMRHMSCVTCHKVVKLVGGGFVINGATCLVLDHSGYSSSLLLFLIGLVVPDQYGCSWFLWFFSNLAGCSWSLGCFWSLWFILITLFVPDPSFCFYNYRCSDISPNLEWLFLQISQFWEKTEIFNIFRKMKSKFGERAEFL